MLGDTIALQKGQTFEAANFTYPHKDGSSGYITVTTNDPASIPTFFSTAWPNSFTFGTHADVTPGIPAGTGWIGDFTRPTPAMTANMPKLVVTANSTGNFFAPASHHWKFIGVEFTNKLNGVQYNLLVSSGGDTSDLNTLPTDITFDQCWIHPIEEVGDLTSDVSDRSVEMGFIWSGYRLTVTHSAVNGFTGWNRFPTPANIRLNANPILIGYGNGILWQNDLIEGNGQIFFSGGGIPTAAHTSTVSSCTLTQCTFAAPPSGLAIGDIIAVYSANYSANQQRRDPNNPGNFVNVVGHYINGRVTGINGSVVSFSGGLTGNIDYRQQLINLWGASGGHLQSLFQVGRLNPDNRRNHWTAKRC